MIKIPITAGGRTFPRYIIKFSIVLFLLLKTIKGKALKKYEVTPTANIILSNKTLGAFPLKLIIWLSLALFKNILEVPINAIMRKRDEGGINIW